MRKNLGAIALAILAASCGSNTETPPNKSTSGPANRPIAQQSATNNSEQPAAPANDVNNAKENPLTAARNRKIEAMRQSGSQPGAQNVDIEKILQQSTRPAPEDSEFSVALTDILYERRVFHKNAVLAKVEKISRGEEKTLKVYLTDGRVLDLPPNSIASVSTASSASILRAANIEAPGRTGTGDTKPRAPAKN